MADVVDNLLDTLIEECAEVIQRATKAKRFGLNEVQPGHELDNRLRLNCEWNDLLAVVELLKANGVELFRSDELIIAKKAKIRHFLKYSQELGVVELKAAVAE